MEITALREQIKVVAALRLSTQTLNSMKKETQMVWEKENSVLLESIRMATESKEAEEANLREMTLQFYAETGNKKPCEGVAVREVIKLEYDPKQALAWGMKHQLALTLDRKIFEGMVKTTPLDFVTVRNEAQATISTELKIEEE